LKFNGENLLEIMQKSQHNGKCGSGAFIWYLPFTAAPNVGAFSTQKACMHWKNGTFDNQNSNKRNAPYFGLTYPLKSCKYMQFIFCFEYE